jgi:hypothetical protein
LEVEWLRALILDQVRTSFGSFCYVTLLTDVSVVDLYALRPVRFMVASGFDDVVTVGRTGYTDRTTILS